MNTNPNSTGAATAPAHQADEGATVVITHRVRAEKHADYARWLDAIVPLSTTAPGHLDWHIVRPIPGLTETFTVILRFKSPAHLQSWMASAERARLIAQVQPLLVTGDDFYIRSGLDFWFTPTGAKAQVPVRWKQTLVTWSAIFPLALGVPLLVGPALRSVGAPTNAVFSTLCVTGVVVLLMVYVVMPRYTQWVRRWLFS